ncbi:MAG: sodium:solute symporter family protein [Thermovirgaceae bacterium]|nr:sodium:solute symporter family protein [Thermovirgaceae bacterium]
MITRIAVVLTYFIVIVLIGLMARTSWKSSPDNYFLADRKLGTVLLLGTMVATNFSAFTFFGASGAGYRDGYAFFPIMGFGTGFMALSFWVLGRKIRHLGRRHNAITPAELVSAMYGSPVLSLLFALVMIAFTIPYLALQPMAAGYALEELLGLPYLWGCSIVTAIIVLYTLCGGMKAVVWTDLFQGTFMAVLLLVALGTVASYHGGFINANREVMASNPQLFSRPGGAGTYTIGIWFSYILLWFLCDPMFPQLFQRFLSAKNERAISRTMLLYPLICTVIFFLPVSMGVLGHLSFPGLTDAQSDRIVPMMLNAISGDFMASLVVAAALAALMSTMDSQLLTLSSIFSRDILPLFGKRTRHSSLAGHGFVVVLAAAGLLLAFKPPSTILQLATQTFSGLAVLFPTVLFGLYFKRVFSLPAILSIICGEFTLFIFHMRWLSTTMVLPVIWVMLVAFSIYLLTHLVMAGHSGALTIRTPAWLRNTHFYLMAGIFVMAMDFWNWGKTLPTFIGIPAWIWYFVGLSALLTLAMFHLVRSKPLISPRCPDDHTPNLPDMPAKNRRAN